MLCSSFGATQLVPGLAQSLALALHVSVAIAGMAAVGLALGRALLE